MAYPIPAGITNQKIREWNLFLHDFNKAAQNELPKINGKVDWSVLDSNTPFGDYKGGRDFYKKKFSEFTANNAGTTLTEADFPTMQKLFIDYYTQSKNDRPFYDKYVAPNVGRYDNDLATFDPTTSRFDKEKNAKGWIGSDSRNFFFAQDVDLTTGGSQTGTQQYKETIFPSSFDQGEGYYKPNTKGNPGVRLFDKGGILTEPNKNEAKKVLTKKILDQNKDKDFVKRIFKPDLVPSLDLGNGDFATHRMAWSSDDKGHLIYPTVVNQNGKLSQLSDDDAYNYAVKTGEFLRVNDPKLAEYIAGHGYKEAAGWDPNTFDCGGKMDEGGRLSKNGNKEVTKTEDGKNIKTWHYNPVTKRLVTKEKDVTYKKDGQPRVVYRMKDVLGPASTKNRVKETVTENGKVTKSRKFIYNDGGKLYFEGGDEVVADDETIEAMNGGDLEEISETHAVVNADNPDAKDSVTLNNGDKVGNKEVINTETKVVFGNLTDPKTGNLFKDDAKVRAEEMAKLEKHSMPWAKRRLDVLKREEAEAFERQQKLNGDNGGTNHDKGGDLTDPPVKKRLFYVPEDDTMYEVAPDKVEKHAQKLKNAKEFTDVRPEGYKSDKVYLEKNGVLKEFTRENADIILKRPEAEGTIEVYPVMGQKKNTDIQKKGVQDTPVDSIDWDKLPVDYGTSEEALITGPMPGVITQEKVTALKERNKKVEDYTKKFQGGTYNDIIETAINTNRQDVIGNIIDPIGVFKQEHPEIENEEEILEGARNARNNDNTLTSNDIIPKLKKNAEMWVERSKLEGNNISMENVQDSDFFRNGVDNLIKEYKSGVKLKRPDGSELDTKNITDSQWNEIRGQIIQTFRVKTVWDEKAKMVQEETKLALSGKTSTPLAKFIKDVGIDKGIIPLSDEQWKPYFEAMDKIGNKWAPAMVNLGLTIEKDNAAFKQGYQNDVNELSHEVEPEAQKLRESLKLQMQQGLPEEEAQQIWGKFQADIQQRETALFEEWTAKQNANSQQKLKIVEDAINADVKQALVGTIFENMDISKVDKKYVQESIDSFVKLTSSFTNNELGRGERFIKEQNLKIYNGNDYAQQFGVEMRRGVIQMAEGVSGFISFMGGFELSNTVNDFSAQFTANNPQYEMGHFEVSKLANPDYWVALTGTMAGQQLVFLPLSVMGAGLGTQVASRIGLGAIGTATLRGIGGAIAVRPFNAMVNSGDYYNELLANGTPMEEAAKLVADDFTYQLSIGMVDVVQIAAGFSPIGNIFKIGKAGAFATKVIGGSVTEGLEEGLEGYHPRDNSFQTIFDYATSTTNIDNMTGGAMGGLVMGGVTSVPDLAAERTGQNKRFLENMIYDMISGPKMGTRYEDVKFTIEGLKERGILGIEAHQLANEILDFVYEKGKDIPVDLAPAEQHQILTNLSQINDLERVMSQTSDETLIGVYEDQIKDIKKKVALVVKGKEPMYFIGNTPYSKEDFQALIEDDQVLSNLTLNKKSIEAYNDPKMNELIEARKQELNKQQYDSENTEGVQSDLGKREEFVEAKSEPRPSEEKVSNDRVVQEEQEVIPESQLTPEQEQAEEDRHAQEEDIIMQHFSSRGDPPPTLEEIDELNSLFHIDEAGVMRDYEGNQTTMDNVVQEYKALKEGTVFESSDGKIRYIREGNEVVRRNAKGQRVEIQRYRSQKVTPKNYKAILKEWEEGGKKGKEPMIGNKYKTKVEPEEGVVFADRKTIEKYDQERLKAGLEEGEPTGSRNFDEIAKTSNSPAEIKAAWEEEKSRLEETNATEGGGDKTELIYDLVKNGISEENAKIIDLDNRDKSISVRGWKIFKRGKGDIDTRIQAINEKHGTDITENDVAEFIKDYPGGPHKYKAERESTLKALENRYKQITGVNIKSTQAKTKTTSKVKTRVEKIRQPSENILKLTKDLEKGLRVFAIEEITEKPTEFKTPEEIERGEDIGYENWTSLTNEQVEDEIGDDYEQFSNFRQIETSETEGIEVEFAKGNVAVFDDLDGKTNPSGKQKEALIAKHGKDKVKQAIFINKNFESIVNDLIKTNKIKREC